MNMSFKEELESASAEIVSDAHSPWNDLEWSKRRFTEANLACAKDIIINTVHATTNCVVTMPT